MGDVLALDVSNYQGDINHLLDTHPEIGRVVVRCSLEDAAKGAITRQQCQTVRDRGLGLDVYVWAYPKWDETDAVVEGAVALVGAFAPDLYWIDCEDTRNFFANPAANVEWLKELVGDFQDRGCRVGIYTGHWFWTAPQMGNSTTLSALGLPLWTATDTKVPDRMQGWEYGGWTRPFAGVQYDLSGPDRDCFDAALYAAPEEPTVPEQTDAAKLSYLSALTHDVLPQVIAELEQVRPKAPADAAHLARALTALRAHAG